MIPCLLACVLVYANESESDESDRSGFVKACLKRDIGYGIWDMENGKCLHLIPLLFVLFTLNFEKTSHIQH